MTSLPTKGPKPAVVLNGEFNCMVVKINLHEAGGMGDHSYFRLTEKAFEDFLASGLVDFNCVDFNCIHQEKEEAIDAYLDAHGIAISCKDQLPLQFHKIHRLFVFNVFDY